MLFVAPEAEASRYDGRSGRYEGRFDLFLNRVSLADTLPLREGAAATDGGYGLVIDELMLSERLLRVRARGWHVRTMFDRRPRPGYEFYLRNAAAGEAMASSNSSQERPLVPSLASLDIDPASRGFSVGRMEVFFQRRKDQDDAWFRNAELVMVRAQYEGSVTRTFHVDRLTFAAAGERQ